MYKEYETKQTPCVFLSTCTSPTNNLHVSPTSRKRRQETVESSTRLVFDSSCSPHIILVLCCLCTDSLRLLAKGRQYSGMRETGWARWRTLVSFRGRFLLFSSYLQTALDNELSEESNPFRFLRPTCLTNLKGSLGLILVRIGKVGREVVKKFDYQWNHRSWGFLYRSICHRGLSMFFWFIIRGKARAKENIYRWVSV